MMIPGTFFGMQPQAAMLASPFQKRLELVKRRCCSYPLDSMDFILIDLEQPETIRRHADFCTGDLSGRYLEMLSVSMPHDGSDESRMHELFARILKCQSRQGPFGRPYVQDIGTSVEGLVFGTSYKLFMGLLRYYLRTGNGKALTGAMQNAEYFLDHMDYVKTRVDKHKKDGSFSIHFWITEPMSLLYAITGDTRYMDVCRLIAGALPENINGVHAHGLMTTLRGLQFAALYTGDLSFNVPVEKFRQVIAAKAVWADGNISEVLPMSGRNEGCAISDWIMLNLYAGFITGADEAYDKAERAMYNAFSLNQIISGATGTRQIRMDGRGYLQGELSEECWWCCAHTAGVALAEYANHAVIWKDGQVRVNLLVPGQYAFDIEGRHVTVLVTTRYPETANTIILVSGAPEETELRLRVPDSIKNAKIKADRLPGGNRRYILSGDMGYFMEEAKGGVVLKYGPLVLVPLRYMSGNEDDSTDYSLTSVPQGYVPENMPKDYPAIVPSVNRDAAGFLIYGKEPRPVWQCHEEGVLSPLAYGEQSINVPLYYPDRTLRYARFFPELNSTTSMIGFDLPVVFDKG